MSTYFFSYVFLGLYIPYYYFPLDKYSVSWEVKCFTKEGPK